MVDPSTPNANLIRAVAEALDGETWETVHRLTTYRVRQSDGKNQEIETTVLYNPDHGWRIDAVDMDSDLKATSNADHDLDTVVSTTHWFELDR